MKLLTTLNWLLNLGANYVRYTIRRSMRRRVATGTAKNSTILLHRWRTFDES